MSASTPPPTRGFVGRRGRQRDRLPPGQYDVGGDWPVLTAEVTPRLDPERWTMTVDGLVDDADHLDLGRDARAAASEYAATSTA